MANSTITSPGSPTTTTPGAQPVDDKPKQPLVPGGVVPGEDMPLPGEQPTPKNGQGSAGLRSQTGAPTSGTGATSETKKPTVSFGSDQVTSGPAQGPNATSQTEPPAGKAFGDYTLPDGDQAVDGQRDKQTNELAGGLVGAVGDVVKGLFQQDGIKWIQERTDHFVKNPQDGVITSMGNNVLSEKLGPALQEAFAASPLRDQIKAQFGDTALRLTDAAKGTAVDFLMNNGLQGFPEVSMQKTWGNFAAASLGLSEGYGQAIAGASLRQLGLPTGLGDTPSFTGQDGKVDMQKVADFLGPKGPAMIEACLEYFISHAARLLKGDTANDLAIMQSQLQALKEEKKGIIAQMLVKEGSVLGLQLSGSEAAKKAKEAQDCARTWQMVGCIIALVVVIVVAIVVTVFSCGSAGPAAMMAVFAVSSGVASVLCATLVIAAITVAVCTLISSLPTLMNCVALILKALGFDDAAAKLEEAAADFEKFLNESGLGTALMVISIVCSLYMAVIMLPIAAASLASVGASAGAAAGGVAQGAATTQAVASGVQAGTAVAQTGASAAAIGGAAGGAAGGAVGATAGAAAAQAVSTMQTMTTICSCLNAGAMLLQGATKVVAAAYMKDFAKMQAELDDLRRQLATVEIQIKELLHEIEKKRVKEQDLKDDIQERQDQEQRIMESYNKAAESVGQIYKTTASDILAAG